MTEIETVIEKIKSEIAGAGIPASVTGWQGKQKYRYDQPVISVSVGKTTGTDAGFSGYIGLEYDEEKDTYVELYGKKLDMTLILDIFAPADEKGGVSCSEVFAALAAVLGDIGGGIKIREISCGDVSYDRDTDMYKCRAEANFTAYLYAKAQDDTEFLTFTLKGELV